MGGGPSGEEICGTLPALSLYEWLLMACGISGRGGRAGAELGRSEYSNGGIEPSPSHPEGCLSGKLSTLLPLSFSSLLLELRSSFSSALRERRSVSRRSTRSRHCSSSCLSD